MQYTNCRLSSHSEILTSKAFSDRLNSYLYFKAVRHWATSAFRIDMLVGNHTGVSSTHSLLSLVEQCQSQYCYCHALE